MSDDASGDLGGTIRPSLSMAQYHLDLLDELVEHGQYNSRSEAVRQGIVRLHTEFKEDSDPLFDAIDTRFDAFETKLESIAETVEELQDDPRSHTYDRDRQFTEPENQSQSTSSGVDLQPDIVNLLVEHDCLSFEELAANLDADPRATKNAIEALLEDGEIESVDENDTTRYQFTPPQQ